MQYWRMEGCLWYFIHEVFIIDSAGPSRPMFRSSSKNNKFLPSAQALGAGRPTGIRERGRAGPASNATCSPGFQKEFSALLLLLVELCV
jgi:hypothetical protein